MFCKQAHSICSGSNGRLCSRTRKVRLTLVACIREIQPQTICWDWMPATRRPVRRGKEPFTIGKERLTRKMIGELCIA